MNLQTRHIPKRAVLQSGAVNAPWSNLKVTFSSDKILCKKGSNPNQNMIKYGAVKAPWSNPKVTFALTNFCANDDQIKHWALNAPWSSRVTSR